MDGSSPRWKTHPFQVGAPTALWPWLRDGTSLTARIKTRCSEFRVHVLRQCLARANADERRIIGLAEGELAWLREVLLLADGNAVVFAHTVLAPRHLRGPWRMAAGVGGRPLGAALFADPRVVRGPLRCARLKPGHPLHRHAEVTLGKTLPMLWARRSRFVHDGQPLLVTEVFLPSVAHLG